MSKGYAKGIIRETRSFLGIKSPKEKALEKKEAFNRRMSETKKEFSDYLADLLGVDPCRCYCLVENASSIGGEEAFTKSVVLPKNNVVIFYQPEFRCYFWVIPASDLTKISWYNPMEYYLEKSCWYLGYYYESNPLGSSHILTKLDPSMNDRQEAVRKFFGKVLSLSNDFRNYFSVMERLGISDKNIGHDVIEEVAEKLKKEHPELEISARYFSLPISDVNLKYCFNVIPMVWVPASNKDGKKLKVWLWMSDQMALDIALFGVDKSVIENPKIVFRVSEETSDYYEGDNPLEFWRQKCPKYFEN